MSVTRVHVLSKVDGRTGRLAGPTFCFGSMVSVVGLWRFAPFLFLCAARDLSSMERGSFPLVFEFSNNTEAAILGSPIKTMMLLLTDSSASYHKGLLEDYKEFANTHSEEIIYVVLPKDKEPDAAAKYFKGISYDPAVFLVNRSSGQFARPYNPFTEYELGRMGETLNEFRSGFLENVGPKESVAVSLSDASFDSVVGNSKLIMVKFYAPWCSHCKKLAPEYEKAASSLAKKIPPVPMASVDATSNPELKNRFAIETFPTLKLFKKGEFVGNYDGVDMTSSGIVAFMNSYAKAPTDLASLSDVNVLFKGQMTAAVGTYAAGDAQAKELFEEAASGSDHAFGTTNSAEVLTKYGVSPAADDFLNVIIFRKWDRDNQLTKLAW